MAEKKTLFGGICKVPVVMQLEALECGAACLAMVLAYYGKWIPLEQVREDCGVSRDGSNAGNLLRAARNYGMEADGYRIEAADLKDSVRFPCIIHWNFNHFVVVDGIRKGTVYLNDPARGNYRLPMEEFEKSFTGICLEMSPSGQFVPSGRPGSTLAFAGRRLKGTGPAILFTFLVLAVSSLLGVISPAFSRVFMDELLTGQSPGWTVPFFILLSAFTVIQLILTFFTTVSQLRITGKMAAVGSTTYLWKVLHMPINFFSQRMAADIQERQETNASIAGTLVNTFAPMAINAAMLVFYFVVMLRYSVLLTAIGIAGLAIHAVLARYLSAKRVNLARVSVRDEAKLAAATTAGFEMIETIKSGGAEDGYFARWAGLQARAGANEVRSVRLSAYLGSACELLNTLAGSAILVLGVWLTMQGTFTLGMVMAFQGLLTAFFSPAGTFISAGQTIQEMRTNMERVDDVMEHAEDHIFARGGDISGGKLSGAVEIRNVTFGYSPLGKPVVRNFDLSLKPGSYVAIVGSSGCGKSTIAKLLSGLCSPWSGEILFDGKPMSDIDESVFHSSLAIVDQDIILFEDTVSGNIRMWDDSIESFEMILAARDAQIHQDIMERPGGYSGKIIDGGRNLSGGQRQRLEIARVLAQDPTIIVLDEATSALDARTEYEVIRAIRDRGITCVVVAHRLSTIRSCDEIVVLDHGEVAGRGTHQELMESCGIYRDLVISD